MRTAILNGTHAAGTQLRQDALAEAYGVSRIPVREALFQLEAEGLVRITPQKGAIVSELSVAEINDVFELRAILEPRLLEPPFPHSGRRISRALRKSRPVSPRRPRRATSPPSASSMPNSTWLYRHADLPRTQGIVATLLQTSDRYTRVQLSSAAAMAVAVAEHAQLIDLCRADARAKAVALLRGHIETVHRDLLRVVDKAG